MHIVIFTGSMSHTLKSTCSHILTYSYTQSKVYLHNTKKGSHLARKSDLGTGCVSFHGLTGNGANWFLLMVYIYTKSIYLYKCIYACFLSANKFFIIVFLNKFIVIYFWCSLLTCVINMIIVRSV